MTASEVEIDSALDTAHERQKRLWQFGGECVQNMFLGEVNMLTKKRKKNRGFVFHVMLS